MLSLINLAERPEHPGLGTLDDAVAALSEAVAALRAAELAVQARKAALAAAVPKVDDPDLAKRLAVWMYWNMPEVPAAPLAEMATALTGGQAQQAFFKLLGTRTITVTCGTCGKPVAVRSRDEMKRVLVAKQKHGVLPICELCRASQREPAPAFYSERSVRNSTPSAFDREVLTLYAERGQPKTIEALDILGVLKVELSPNNIRLYLQDADLGIAAALGVTREDYLAWLEGGGSVRCSGTTTRGDRCRNIARGLGGLDLKDWLRTRAAGGYCAAHGQLPPPL